MALTLFTGDADVISQLSNQPNDNDGLSATQLKGKFDQTGAAIKAFLNETHIPEVESAINAAAAGIGTEGFSGAIIRDGTITAEKLSTQSGFEAVKTEVIRSGAVTLPKLASALQALLATIPNKAIFSQKTATLLSNGWSNNQQTVSVQGVTANNAVLAFGGNDTASHTAWSNNDIWGVSQGDGTITFQCRTVPSTDVNVNILILDTEG